MSVKLGGKKNIIKSRFALHLTRSFSISMPKSTCSPGTWINYMLSVTGGQIVILTIRRGAQE